MPADVNIRAGVEDAEVVRGFRGMTKAADQWADRVIKKQKTIGEIATSTAAKWSSVAIAAGTAVTLYNRLDDAAEAYIRRNQFAALATRQWRIEQEQLSNAMGRFLARDSAVTRLRSKASETATGMLTWASAQFFGYKDTLSAVGKEENARVERIKDQQSISTMSMQVDTLSAMGRTMQAARKAVELTKLQAEVDLKAKTDLPDADREALRKAIDERYGAQLFGIQREMSTGVGGGAPTSLAIAALGNAPFASGSSASGDVKQLVDLAKQQVSLLQSIVVERQTSPATFGEHRD